MHVRKIQRVKMNGGSDYIYQLVDNELVNIGKPMTKQEVIWLIAKLESAIS